MSASALLADERPLVLHVVHRFDTGGLENGVVNLINHMPEHAYRHAVLALTEVTDFRRRVVRSDVEFHALGKRPGQGFWVYPQMLSLLRRLRPQVVHTRNLGPLEMQLPAWLVGVPARVHGEHGRDVSDLDGSNVSHQRVRRLYRHFVHRQVALSADLAGYLQECCGVPAAQIVRACNGVDTARFAPPESAAAPVIEGCPFNNREHFIVGTVGRMAAVKDQLTLVRAFIQVLDQDPALVAVLRLVLVGDGPLRSQCQEILERSGWAALAWLPGERSDVPEIMRGLSLFALPSLAEGISNTILEAMSCGRAVLATAVGGNAELVDSPSTGRLVPPADADAMARVLAELVRQPAVVAAMGSAGRDRVLARFSLQTMVATYQRLYDSLLKPRQAQVLARPRS